MNVTPSQVILRGLANRCPNCGDRTLFQPEHRFRLHPACPACGLKLEREEGFFLGAMALNYGVTTVGFLVPVAWLWYRGVLGDGSAAGLALGGAFVVPLALYRSSRSWQLMLYYSLFPQHLPANRHPLAEAGDENG